MIKTFKTESRIATSFFNDKNVETDYFYKAICHELINSLDVEDVKKIFNIKIIDPSNEMYSSNIMMSKVPYGSELRAKLIELFESNTIEITAEIKEYNLY